MMDYVIATLLVIGFSVVLATISTVFNLSKLTNDKPGGWLSQFIFALFGSFIGELIGLGFNAGLQTYGVYWIPVVIFAFLFVILGTPTALHWPGQAAAPQPAAAPPIPAPVKPAPTHRTQTHKPKSSTQAHPHPALEQEQTPPPEPQTEAQPPASTKPPANP
jgi:hypothetical protein